MNLLRLNRLFLFITLCAPQFINAQAKNFISGKVTDDKTGLPIAGCSVYISNTSKGDITNASGGYTLNKLPAGKYELIVSAIGYETAVIPISSDNYPGPLQVILHMRSVELSEVTVHPFLTNGWEKWGQFFLDNFMGTIPNASQCQLRNREVIKFWFSEKSNTLTVRAEEPLIIDNDALGYTIKFKLEQFSADFNGKMIVYTGYPLFNEMTATNEKRKSKWKENRQTAFYGSMLHFMRCVYNDSWHAAGYNIVTHVMRPNAEKLRAKKMMTGANDSTAYFKKVMKQPDTLSEYVDLAELDSMLITYNDQTKSFYFNDKLEILYRRYPQSKPQQSVIYLATPQAVQIQQNGSYFSVRELVTGDHWAQYEKIANMLPFDYEP